MDNFSDKVMSSIALSLIFITLNKSLVWNFWSQQRFVDDIIYEESLVGEEEELGHHHAQAEAGDGVAENHQCVLVRESGGGIMFYLTCQYLSHWLPLQGHGLLLLHSLCSWSRHTESLLHSSIYTGLSHIITYFQFKTDSDSLWYISTSENWEHKWNGRNNTDCCQLL